MVNDSGNHKALVIFSQGYQKRYPSIIKGLNDIDGVYAAENFKYPLLRDIRRTWVSNSLPGISIWFGSWKKYLSECGTVICMANNYSPYILHWIKKNYPSIKCINYFWDGAGISGYPIEDTSDFENWSFCRSDCDKYGFRYNPQFYVKLMRLPDLPTEYDVVFVGADRNGRSKYRTEALNKFLKLFKENGISSYIWYLSDDPDAPKIIRRSYRLREKDYLLVTAKAKAVLELSDSENPWITMRPLLALSNGRKVITNNPAVQDERYYSPDDIFITGYDNNDDLKDFIDSPFVPISEEDLRCYEAFEWIRRFET